MIYTSSRSLPHLLSWARGGRRGGGGLLSRYSMNLCCMLSIFSFPFLTFEGKRLRLHEFSPSPKTKAKGNPFPVQYSVAQILTLPRVLLLLPDPQCHLVRFSFFPPIDISKSFSSSLSFDSEVEKSILSCLRFPIKYKKQQEEAAADLHLPTRPTLSPT